MKQWFNKSWPAIMLIGSFAVFIALLSFELKHSTPSIEQTLIHYTTDSETGLTFAILYDRTGKAVSMVLVPGDKVPGGLTPRMLDASYQQPGPKFWVKYHDGTTRWFYNAYKNWDGSLTVQPKQNDGLYDIGCAAYEDTNATDYPPIPKRVM
jgi:hypothetical protein